MADLGELAAKLKILSDAYAAQLPEKFTKLERIWNQLPQNEWREEGFEMLHRSVHSLTGSGKTFGFTALSDVARKLEDYLNRIGQTRIPPDGEQRNHIASLIAELRQVAIDRDQHPADHSKLITIKPGRIAHDTVRRIFIVEDDIAFAENLKNQLSYFGYDVSAYNSLSEFKQAIQENDDIVVVMDISFPEDSWGGVHIMKEVQKNRTSPLPVVFLSSHDDLKARLEAVRAGGIAYFNKSLNLSNLIDKLDELTSTQQAAPYRVLIIDDSPSLTAFYAAVLEEVGMVTRSINDPLDVMQPLLEFEPDLILIDMYMPGCNGMELARVIRQLEAFISIPIVFLSGEKDIDKQLVAMNLGGDDFLTKPIHPQHLVASVSSRIRRSLMLRSFMVRDSLTGLLNHTAIKDQLDREVARSRRAGVRCCFAMVDIDFFKKVNDTYGHPVGDRVIKSLSRLLKQRLRESDAVGRYGGEEFAVILADADSATARKVLDTIREDFSRLRHMSDGVEFSVTFSCGIADVADFPDAKKMADAADRALYTAKHAGRNQVSIASAEMSAI